jgi:hypothetical protein
LRWKVQSFHRDFSLKLWFANIRREEKENEEGYSSIGESLFDVNQIMSFKTFLQRVMDDDRLKDSCWNSEKREVELWENERFGGRFLFFVHHLPFNHVSQARILHLILHRLVRTTPSQPPPPLLLFHSLCRLPLLHSTSLTSLPKARTVHESPTEPITGLGFREPTGDMFGYLCVVTTNRILSYLTSVEELTVLPLPS